MEESQHLLYNSFSNGGALKENDFPPLIYEGSSQKNIELLQALENIEMQFDEEIKDIKEERKMLLRLDNSYESLYNVNISCGDKVKMACLIRKQSIKSLRNDYFGEFIYNRW